MSTSRWRLQAKTATLLLLVAVCACVSWALRVVWDQNPVNHWTRLLRDTRPEQRLEAAIGLANESGLDDPARASAVLPLIIAATDDEDPRVRLEVLRCLTTLVVPIKGIGSPGLAIPNRPAELAAIVATMTRKLHDSDTAVRVEALNGLWALGPYAAPAVPDLIEALSDQAPLVRGGAVKALSQIAGAEDAWIPALLRMRADRDPNVRIAVFSVLRKSKVGLEVVLPLLLNGIGDQDANVRRAAQTELDLLAIHDLPFAITALTNPTFPPEARIALARTLSGRATPSGTIAIDQLKDLFKRKDPLVRAWVPIILGRIGKYDVVDFLLAETHDPDAQRVAEALAGLSAVFQPEYDKRSLIAPIKLLDDETSAGQARGIAQLLVLGEDAERAIPALRSLAKRGDEITRKAAEDARATIERAVALRNRVRGEAGRLINHESASVCRAALGLLDETTGGSRASTVPRKELVSRAINWLRDDSKETRLSAVMILNSLSTDAQPALPALAALPKDEDEEIREYAASVRKSIEQSITAHRMIPPH